MLKLPENNFHYYGKDYKSWLWETNLSVHNILIPEIITDINLEESTTISNWIKEENKIHKHMIEKPPIEIMEEINSWLWYVAKIKGEIVWIITMIDIILSNWDHIYEAWSLFISPEKRGHWLAKVLTKELFSCDSWKAIYSITEVPRVIHIYEDILRLNIFTKSDLEIEILKKIEEVWALLPTDKIYWNQNFLDLNNIKDDK